MGVDLSLLPLMGRDFWASQEVIQLERRRDLWPLIQGVPQKDIPRPISCFMATGKGGETQYGACEMTPYGDRMKFTTAGDLMKIGFADGVQDNWKNRAAWAYIDQMPSDWPIVLYWH